MEFSYRISEADYLRAARLKFKEAFRLGRIGKIAMIWVVIIAGLVCAVGMVQIYSHRPPSNEQEIVETAPAEPLTNRLIENVVPVIVILGVMAFVLSGRVPMGLRSIYRKDPSMQGQFTVKITPDSILIENTAGTTFRAGWNIYERWSEERSLIVLVLHSGAYFMISKAGLSDPQQNELRGILTAALPKK
ncbi:MAG: YcxB family protein [Terracidiphilus sp.]|jgi:hypothetical protein